MELISRERAIEDICSIESEVARNMPYDKEWFDRMCDRQHEIIEIIKALPTVQSTDYEQGYHDGFVDGMNYRKSRNGYGG